MTGIAVDVRVFGCPFAHINLRTSQCYFLNCEFANLRLTPLHFVQERCVSNIICVRRTSRPQTILIHRHSDAKAWDIKKDV